MPVLKGKGVAAGASDDKVIGSPFLEVSRLCWRDGRLDRGVGVSRLRGTESFFSAIDDRHAGVGERVVQLSSTGFADGAVPQQSDMFDSFGSQRGGLRCNCGGHGCSDERGLELQLGSAAGDAQCPNTELV